MMPPDLRPYVVLMKALLEKRISAEEFSTVYVRLFTEDASFRPREIFEPLNDVFGAADLYYSDARVGERFEVGEMELRRTAEAAVVRLEEALTSSPE